MNYNYEILQVVSEPNQTKVSTVESVCSISSDLPTNTPAVFDHEQAICNEGVIEEAKQFTTFIHLNNSNFHIKLESDKNVKEHSLDLRKMSDALESDKFSFYEESEVAPLASPELSSEAVSLCSRNSIYNREYQVMQANQRADREALVPERKTSHITDNMEDSEREIQVSSLCFDSSSVLPKEVKFKFPQKTLLQDISEHSNISLGNVPQSFSSESGDIIETVINSIQPKEKHFSSSEKEIDISSFYDSSKQEIFNV